MTQSKSMWPITLIAAAFVMITMGARQSQGLFVSPLNTSTGLGVASISLALAIGQFVWGAAQPLAGIVADKYGPGRVLAFGLILLAFGMAITPFMTSALGLSITLGIVMAAGAGAASFSVLIGATAQHIAAEQRGMSSGVINAGSSMGQFLFAPITQKLISTIGWMGAMWSLAVIALAALPLARVLRRRDGLATPNATAGSSPAGKEENAKDVKDVIGVRRAIADAFKDRSYLLLHAGFFTCGFHIAFLVTHLPGEVELCGLPPTVASWSLAIIGIANVIGSLVAGWCVGHYRSKYILFWMYASRAVLIALYLAAPKTTTTFYIFAFGLGLTWLATVPPTAGIVGKLFGVRYLSTLFGLTLVSHQTGAFFGAWLGGIAVTELGSYQSMWVADIILAALAAVINLPIREAKVQRPRLATS